MRVSLIVAVSENGIIGADGKIPWRLPNDLKRFKELTMGHCLIMGRKTYESIGKPLPGRTTLVLTKQIEVESSLINGVLLFPDLPAAFNHAEHRCDDDEVFICGGGEVYKEALPYVHRVYRTVVEQRYGGDTMFVMDFANFKKFETEHRFGEELPYRFEIWDRVRR